MVRTKANRIVHISGDKQHPNSAGFACLKGTRAHELLDHPVASTTRSNGWDGVAAAQWQEISWEQALDESPHRSGN